MLNAPIVLKHQAKIFIVEKSFSHIEINVGKISLLPTFGYPLPNFLSRSFEAISVQHFVLEIDVASGGSGKFSIFKWQVNLRTTYL